MSDEFKDARKRILVDFDGVIHKNDHWNWNGGKCTGPVIAGAKEAIERLTAGGWEVVIFTARDDRSIITQVEPWLKENKIFKGYICDYGTKAGSSGEMLRVTNRKEPAQFYVDDRAYRFTSWDDVTRLVS